MYICMHKLQIEQHSLLRCRFIGSISVKLCAQDTVVCLDNFSTGHRYNIDAFDEWWIQIDGRIS